MKKYKRCIECGIMFMIDKSIKNKKRCDECQEIANKERYIRYNHKR